MLDHFLELKELSNLIIFPEVVDNYYKEHIFGPLSLHQLILSFTFMVVDVCRQKKRIY